MFHARKYWRHWILMITRPLSFSEEKENNVSHVISFSKGSFTPVAVPTAFWKAKLDFYSVVWYCNGRQSFRRWSWHLLNVCLFYSQEESCIKKIAQDREPSFLAPGCSELPLTSHWSHWLSNSGGQCKITVGAKQSIIAMACLLPRSVIMLEFRWTSLGVLRPLLSHLFLLPPGHLCETALYIAITTVFFRRKIGSLVTSVQFETIRGIFIKQRIWHSPNIHCWCIFLVYMFYILILGKCHTPCFITVPLNFTHWAS